jgi:hypothetical protein
MQKFEITVSPDYVAKWTIVDAVRELLQNAIDAETTGHLMRVEYNEKSEELTVHSVGAKLDISSLLLGTTSKANDAKSIGQFGEGYKIATLVLLRNNKTVVFSNGLAKETWRPRFIKSRRFGCNVLGFFIEKWSPFSAPVNELIVSVQGITNQEYFEQIVPSALMLRKDWSAVERTSLGDIINVPGAVFVNGLYVRGHEPYKYGYNFKPQYLQLDRDRKLISDFDLEWLASKMWAASSDHDTVIKLISENSADTKYLVNNMYGKIELSNQAWQEFILKYGANAIPVTTQEELEKLSKKYKPVLVGSGYRDLLIRSSDYVEPDEEKEELLSARFTAWFDNNELSDLLSREAEDEFNNLVDELRRSE